MSSIQYFLLFTLLCLFSQRSMAQVTISGLVVDQEKKPLARASVFLNNTSVGTTSGEDGKFSLRIPEGRFELIISSVGFETRNLSLSTQDTTRYFLVEMKPRSQQLENLVVRSFENQGWEKWGKLFRDLFIGTRAESRECIIQNPEVLRFRFRKEENELQVIATRPLIIENRALGYLLTYDLVTFEYNFKTRYLLYSGYPFFEELNGTEARKRKWEKKRNEVYEGSMMHFMRALYRNQIQEEGFDVRRLVKEDNLERKRVSAAVSRYIRNNPGKDPLHYGDSSAYYRKVLDQQDPINHFGNTLITGDSIAFAIDPLTAGLEFEDYLYIVYRKKKAPAEFSQVMGNNSNQMISEITLLNNPYVQVKSNGMFYESTDLMSIGYWSWSEKIAAMLPFDFKPSTSSK